MFRPSHLELDEKDLYPAEDGQVLDDVLHFDNAAVLKSSLAPLLPAPAFIAFNNFIYYELGSPNKNVGPDFYVVLDTPHDDQRDCWRVWNENGRLPQVIIEFVSKHSGPKDRVKNFAIYRDTLKTPNYFICDHRRKFRFEGFRLEDGQYVPLKKNAQGRLWCDQLGLWLGFHDGYLRWFKPDGTLLPSAEEAVAAERDRAEAEAARAEVEAARAEAEAVRRRETESELARLRAEIERLRE